MWKRLSLASRLFLYLALPVAFGVLGYGYVHVRLRREEMLADAMIELEDHATTLKVALDAFLRDRQLQDLSDLTEDLTRADRVLGVLVFDAQGHPLRTSSSVRHLLGVCIPLAREAERTERSVGRRLSSERTPDVYAYAFPVGGEGNARPRGSAVLVRDLGYVKGNLRRSAVRVAVAGSTLLALLVFALWLGIRSAMRQPLASLLSGVAAVGSGSLSARVEVLREDELGRVGTAFNEMVSSLRLSREKLDQQHENYLALERRLQQAQRLALVGQLAANIAHQVGSPLQVIAGRARYALRLGGQSERDERHFREILQGAERISGILETLLAQARKRRGQAGPVELAELARTTLTFLETECEAAGILPKLETTGPVVVHGVREEFEQLLFNLCVNALQAQPKGGVLLVAVSKEHRSSPVGVLRVIDQGPGIPMDLREKIFEPFFSTRESEGGTGLGLAICAELVSRSGGTIHVEPGKDGGTCFRIELPIEPEENQKRGES